jgi:hypothetical protein
MTPTQKLQQIKNWLFNWNSPYSFQDYKTTDGMSFQVDGDLMEGKEAYKLNEDGSTSPLEDGEYIVEGKTLDIVKGIIGSIKTKEEIEENPNIPQAIKDAIKKENMSKEKFVSDFLLDGTEIHVDGEAIEVGKMLHIVKDGEFLKPPAGDHETKSGVIVSVDEEGKITAMKPVEKEEVEIEVKSAEEEPVKDEQEVEDESIKGMMKQVMEAIEEMKQKMADMKDKQEKMKEEFSSFKKEPAGEPLKRHSQPSLNNEKDYRMKVIDMLRGGK